MIGMILATGSPFWPWQVLQVCKLSSSSSALAGRAKIARIVTAPAMVKMRILHICCTALVSGRVAGTPGRDEAGVDGSNTCRGPACGASPDFESQERLRGNYSQQGRLVVAGRGYRSDAADYVKPARAARSPGARRAAYR